MVAGLHQLESHAEVVMLDFAASLLAELEKWMSSASTAMVNMASYADSEAFIGPTSVVEEVHKRLYTDEVMTHRAACPMLERHQLARAGVLVLRCCGIVED